jgi:quercetin dioxygenase-like cupin family protein
MSALPARRSLAAGIAAAGTGIVLLALLLGGGKFPAPHVHVSAVPGMASMAQRPATKVTVISTHAIPDLKGKQMTAVVVDFPPGAFSPEHHHEGSLTVYVLKGTIRSQLDAGPAQIYTAGQSFFEPLGAIHTFAENMSTTEDAQILAVFVHDQGARLTVYH